MKTKLSLILVSVCLTLFSSGGLLAAEGGSAGTKGGGYMDFNGRKILNAAITELNALVPVISLPVFNDHPERRSTLLQALNHVQVRSREARTRNGQSLIMDYDLGHQRIVALKPFFEGFQTFAVTRDTLLSAEQLLLHETAHLWGDDDLAADRFAQDFLAAARLLRERTAKKAEKAPTWTCGGYCVCEFQSQYSEEPSCGGYWSMTREGSSAAQAFGKVSEACWSRCRRGEALSYLTQRVAGAGHPCGLPRTTLKEACVKN